MAHRLAEIKKRLEQGLYDRQPDKAQTNLQVLQRDIIDKAGVWKKTKEEAQGLSERIRGMTERVDVAAAVPKPAAAAAPASPVPELVAAPPAPVAAAPKQSIAERLQDLKGKLARGIYQEQPEKLAKNIRRLDKMESAVERALGAEQPALLADIREVKAMLVEVRPMVAAANSGVITLAPVPELVAAPVDAAANSSPHANSLPSSNADESEEIDPLIDLDRRILACQKDCAALALEKKAIEEFRLHNSIAEISMSKESKLIDLLRDRILDPSPEWSTHLQTLINIPHSLKGTEYLRGGDYFEAFFQIAIAIKELSMFRDKYIHFYDISNYKDLNPLSNYLHTKTVQNSGGGEHGISDITFVCSDTPDPDVFTPSSSYKCGMPVTKNTLTANPMYFISVKGYKKEKSPTKDYDIPLLNMQLSIFPDIKEKNIMVCVRDKKKFLNKLGRSSDMLKHIIADRVVGFDELITAFTNFRIKIFSQLDPSPTTEQRDELLRRLFPESGVHKPMLSLYFHQELVVDSVMRRITAEAATAAAPHYMCVGVLPRGGKSFIAGGIINQHKARKGGEPYNVLFLTSAVNETRTQFREDLIAKFSDFDDFSFIDVVNDPRSTEKANKFYFISRQLSTLPTLAKQVRDEERQEVSLLDRKPGEADILKTLEEKLGYKPTFDICFFDEAHIGITAGSVRKNFDSIFSALPGIPIILMTATYKRPSAVLRSNEDLFVWDLQDIKDMKSLPVLGLDEFIRVQPDVLVRYPHAHELLQKRVAFGETLDNLAKPYLQFANPNFISLTFAPEEVRRMIETGATYEYMDFFEINQNSELLGDPSRSTDWMTLLRNREHAERLLSFLTPVLEPRKLEDGRPVVQILDGPNRRFRALNQIFTIAQKHGSRPMQGRPFSILMFMPYRQAEHGSSKGPIRIGELCRIWASYMMSSSYWKENFVFLTLSAYGGHRPTGLTIQQAVAKGLVHREDYAMDLKTLIRDVEREALKIDKGLVILSGDVAKMGISLPCVDVVFMMSNNPDADDIIQKMYRALTDDPPQKKDGFIVDLNLKRIVSAMFDYDLQKDKLRTSSIQLPSVEDRAIRLFNLCDWGQDQFMDDTAGVTFDDVMKLIKDRVVNAVRDKVLRTNDIKHIMDEQTKLLMEDSTEFAHVSSVLKGTAKPKGRRGKTEKLLERGTEIPALGGAGGPVPPTDAEGGAGLTEGPVEKPAVELSPEEIKKRHFEILHTFVNTLVVKSAESWSDKSMNLYALLRKYNDDKAALGGSKPSCECSSDEDCKKVHDNLYEVVYCELKSFAYVGGKLDPEKLDQIIGFIDNSFKTILLEWNIEIESFLNDLRAQQGGSYIMRRKTRRLNRGDGRHRKTLQQRSNSHR